MYKIDRKIIQGPEKILEDQTKIKNIIKWVME